MIDNPTNDMKYHRKSTPHGTIRFRVYRLRCPHDGIEWENQYREEFVDDHTIDADDEEE